MQQTCIGSSVKVAAVNWQLLSDNYQRVKLSLTAHTAEASVQAHQMEWGEPSTTGMTDLWMLGWVEHGGWSGALAAWRCR